MIYVGERALNKITKTKKRSAFELKTSGEGDQPISKKKVHH